MSASVYPENFDTDSNLFLVHDSLRLKLIEDYNPGDTSISVYGDATVYANFPPIGILTLTTQCSHVDVRATSYYYNGKSTDADGNSTFTNLSILPNFTDVFKPAIKTDVTQNVMAEHHNNIKDALVAIEKFAGLAGTIYTAPGGATMEGRINYLRKLAYTPRAWFSVDQTIGLAPLTCNFTSESFGLGDGNVTYVWDLGAEISTISYISIIAEVPSEISAIEISTISEEDIEQEINITTLTKTFNEPGVFTIKLTVTNDYGTSTVEFPALVTVRTEAPNEAEINFTANSNQLSSLGDNPSVFTRLGGTPAGPYTIPPTIRATTNDFIAIEVPTGDLTFDRSYAGELLNNGIPIDPIVTYTWKLGDDLTHPSSPSTTASYSIGGIYDMILRVDTSFGAYRITDYRKTIDIIEPSNLWLFTTDGTVALAHEFGLISETFKTANHTQAIPANNSFLDGIGSYDPITATYPAQIQAQREFARNTGFASMGTSSGQRGEALVCWAGGGATLSASQPVNSFLYEGFSDSYIDSGLVLDRPWNWLFLTNNQQAWFTFGPNLPIVSNTNNSYQVQSTVDLTPTISVSNTTLTSGNYLNGAYDLQAFVTNGYLGNGEPNTGRFACYRQAWKDNTGYFVRNDGAGVFFRFKSFYSTSGTIADPFMNLTKLPDMAGTTKQEGQLVTLSAGLFFFDNSGNVSAYNDVSGVWQVGGSGSATLAFNSLQDSTVAGYGNETNTLLATSDFDTNVYLSFDYSANAFIKFNSVDLTFNSLGSRPVGTQWVMSTY